MTGSLIFSVSGDKCQARLNCYANTDSQIIPILVPSPSPSNTPIYTNITSQPRTLHYHSLTQWGGFIKRRGGSLWLGLCLLGPASSRVLGKVYISSYSYWQWQLTRMREKKEFEPANRGSVFLLQSGCRATAWQCWLPVIADAGLQSKCSNRIITDNKYHLTHHTEFVNKQLFNFSPLKLVGFHLKFSLIFLFRWINNVCVPMICLWR